MGIPKFVNVWLKRRDFKGVFQRSLSGTNSSLLLDANGIIHHAAQLAYGYGKGESDIRLSEIKKLSKEELEKQMFDIVGTLLTNLLTQVRPKSTFVIAIDGVAPMAKIKQQRSRRFMRSPNSLFDSNVITPGTEFMFRLDAYIREWLDKNKLILPITVIYSSHLVPGEGEHKIMDLIRTNQIEGTNSHIVYGLDADLIMLSLMAPIDHILLMREDINEIVNIDNFRTSVEKLMTGKDPIYNPNIWHDYVIIMSLLGNDFIPHSPSLENFSKSVDLLISLYKTLGKPLVEDKEINLKNLMEFFKLLAEKEPELLIEESLVNYKYPSSIVARSRESDGFNVTKFNDEWYFNELTPKGSQSSLIEKIDPEAFTITQKDINQMSIQYVRSVFWVYQYYSQGLAAVNVEWFYNYFHSPLFVDISSLKLDSIDGYSYQEDHRVMTPIHQLLSVLPPDSKLLIPSAFRLLIEPDSIIGDLYPINFIRELEGKHAEWQAIPIIPMVNASRIFEAVNSVSLTEIQGKRYKRKYQQANNVKIVKTLEYQQGEKAFRTYRSRLRAHQLESKERSEKEPREPSERSEPRPDLSEFIGPMIIRRENWLTRDPLI